MLHSQLLFVGSNVSTGPSTFTGEDTAELFVHGSRAVADALAERLAAFEGVRQATRGEFTKRYGGSPKRRGSSCETSAIIKALKSIRNTPQKGTWSAIGGSKF